MGLSVYSTSRYAVLGISVDDVYADVSSSSSTSSKGRCVNKHEEQDDSNVELLSSDVDSFPIIQLEDLLLHEHRKITSDVQNKLISFLKIHGYILLSTVSSSRPGKIIETVRKSIDTELFPPSKDTKITQQSFTEWNVAKLKTSLEHVYVSEKGIPMYKLGYELCEDNVREVFRIAAGDPDSADIWPHSINDEMNNNNNNNNNNNSVRKTWLQGLGLMRHITDTALDLLISSTSCTLKVRQGRPNSGPNSWMKGPLKYPLQERQGDFSVLYAMHYFNNINNQDVDSTSSLLTNSSTSTKTILVPKLPQDGVAVKAHVDPSLFVCEPFLCRYSRGLQVWNRCYSTKCNDNSCTIVGNNNDNDIDNENCWIDCDGEHSPLSCLYNNDQEIILLFVGKAIQSIRPDIEPTLHRVVTGSDPRRSVIYEQKYKEFFAPPTFD
jgi:hypothetical protein